MSIKQTDIERLQKELIQQLSWGAPDQWHSAMFTELSEKIFDQTQVMLSTATLKRFFGVVKHDGMPSISTLDTLSRYLNYENWRDFKYSGKPPRFKIRFNVFQPSVYVSFGFVLALVVVVLIANRELEPYIPAETIIFKSRPVTNTYPNSVVFDLDLGGVNSENLFIQQYWDPNKIIKLAAGQTQATGIYYFPGYFRAKLLVDGQVVKEHDLFLKSNGWVSTLDYSPVPKYFTPKKLEGAILSFPSELLDEVNKSDTPLTSTYHYVNDLGEISGDNFELQARLKSSYNDKWAVCQSTRIYILGTQGAMIIPFSIVGCSSENNLMLNDNYMSGKENDLSTFGINLTDFKDIKIAVRNKVVKIFINENRIYQGSYKETMGLFIGLRFKFLGLGVVASFSVKDQNGVEKSIL